jgi:hypothetical protein
VAQPGAGAHSTAVTVWVVPSFSRGVIRDDAVSCATHSWSGAVAVNARCTRQLRARVRSAAGDRRTGPLGAADPVQASAAHQPVRRTASHQVALPAQLGVDLPDAVHAVVVTRVSRRTCVCQQDHDVVTTLHVLLND